MLDGEVVFLLDVDNTLPDDDRFAADLGDCLEQEFGAEARRYWEIFAGLRERMGFADYLASLQAFRRGLEEDPHLLRMADYLLEYPFSGLLFPQALAAIEHVRSFGRPVVLSDGDVVFQPRKIKRIRASEMRSPARCSYMCTRSGPWSTCSGVIRHRIT